MVLRFLVIICTLLLISKVHAQLELPDSFVQKLEKAQLLIALPVENNYKPIKVVAQKYLPYDYAIRSKEEKLEIRYFIKPFKPADTLYRSIPQVQAMQLLTNVASNDEDAITAVHRIEKTDLEELYQADWGMIAYFQPKLSFSSFSDCKMLALFKDDVAIAYVFYLFDEYNPALDLQKTTLYFQ